LARFMKTGPCIVLLQATVWTIWTQEITIPLSYIACKLNLYMLQADIFQVVSLTYLRKLDTSFLCCQVLNHTLMRNLLKIRINCPCLGGKYFSSNIIRVIKSNMERFVGHAALINEMKLKMTNFWKLSSSIFD
jgi:hypothetical protein